MSEKRSVLSLAREYDMYVEEMSHGESKALTMTVGNWAIVHGYDKYTIYPPEEKSIYEQYEIYAKELEGQGKLPNTFWGWSNALGHPHIVKKELLESCQVYDSVNNPKHYNTGKYEVIDIIEDQNLGFCLGNAIKYILRAGKKDVSKTKEDLEKAIWYINRYIGSLNK